MFNYEPKIGDKVLTRTNEDGPYQIGTLVRFDNFRKDSGQKFPVVEINGIECIHMGIVIEYPGQDVCWFLDGLSYKDQWNFLSQHYKRK